jgi:hypothetical protein
LTRAGVLLYNKDVARSYEIHIEGRMIYMKPVRMSLVVARQAKEQDLKKFFLDKVEELKTERKAEGKEWTPNHIYVFISSSDKRVDKIRKFEIVTGVDEAVKYFMDRSWLKSKRLFIGFGVDYVAGAQDLLITGTDY